MKCTNIILSVQRMTAVEQQITKCICCIFILHFYRLYSSIRFRKNVLPWAGYSHRSFLKINYFCNVAEVVSIEILQQ